MALTGELTDFGIADILQLIGQQGKTGILHLKDKEKTVDIHFVDGNVVKAQSATRNRKDLLGNLMVRAGVLSQVDLDRALEIQKRTLRRLGDILVGEAFVTRDTFREMYQLQTTETLYKLFHWKAGTYEFTQEDVDFDEEAISPIRSENVLMEGFRMVDEWPMVRKKITSYEMTFVRTKELAAAAAPKSDEDALDDDLDAAFGGWGDDDDDDDDDHDDKDGVSPNERRLYLLADPGVNVQQIIDRSRLGEFETCKGLLSLVDSGYLKSVAPSKKNAAPLAGGGVDVVVAVKRAVAQLGVGAMALAAVGVLAYLAVGIGEGSDLSFTPRYGLSIIDSAGAQRVRTAVEVFRRTEGEIPESLDALVRAGYLTERDVSWPHGSPFFYRVDDAAPGGYVLLPPLP